MVYGDECRVWSQRLYRQKRMSEFQGQGKVPKVGRLSDPLFKDVSFIKATERLTYDEKNILISLILQDRNKAVSSALAQERAQKRKN